jgi:two-component system, NtrC family, sensor kinase
MTVLIVDDSLTVRMDLEEAFAAAGLAATSCADLAAARRALAGARFSLVVLDVLLPDGDGLELLEELKRTPRTAGTPVVLLSTEAEVRQRLRGLDVGADEYAGKPYDVAAVVARGRELAGQAVDDETAGERVEVLVVDDSLTVREELRSELERAGFAVATAASGEEGLRVAADRLPGAVVVDGAMPGMDGAAFIRHLRADAALRTTPCILLTASQSVGELGALDAGADAYVRKEEGHDVVLARLQALLRTSSPTSAWTPSLLSPKRVVIVSADAGRQRELAEQLRGDGHDGVGARDVEGAVALLARDRLDAVVLDGGGRFEAALGECVRIRSAVARDVPLLLVGDGEGHDLLPRALDAGADDYVASMEGEVLRARVRAQLRRKQFEDENRLRDSYARNSAILETIADAFFAADREWRLVYVNHAFEDLVGCRREALLGERPWELADASGIAALEPELRRAAEDGAPRTFEAPFPGERWFEVRAFPHEDGLSAHLRDVTERRRSQEVQAHLLGIVGHDLRTPLTSIRVSASGLVRDPSLGERRLRALERIEAGAVRMTRLINDLLDYSRARLGHGLPLERIPADMDQICREAIDAVRAAYPARTIAYRPAGDGAGEWDPERIQQGLVNLLTNAVRHGAPDSEVTLAWRAEPGRTVVSVHNHGAPIDPALLGHLFEPFKRGAPRGAPAGAGWGGVGLGLYIVRQIVVAHGGSVGVRSEAGAGTTFEMVLPRRIEPVATA